ncbi:hypothetical protein [Elizabethkingia ursingii]
MNTIFYNSDTNQSHPLVYKRIVYVSSKKTYTKPVLHVEIIELENSFAAGSATLFPGNTNDLNTPYVEDWTNQGSIGNQDVDL